MNFFKKLIGLEKDLAERINQFKARGSLYEVEKDIRNMKFKDCTIAFQQESDYKYCISFSDNNKESFQVPIHINMNPVNFKINKAGKQLACFQWQLQHDSNTHVGCNMEIQHKQEFKAILCLILKQITKDQHIKDELAFCKELSGIPVYKIQSKANSNISSSISNKTKEDLNVILIAQAQKKDTRMVHTCSCYSIQQRERNLINEHAIFVLKTYPDFAYEFQLINFSGFAFLRKTIEQGLNYEINIDKGYIRYIDTQNDCRIVEVNFDGKRDAALSLKYNLFEVMYELKEKKNIQQNISTQEIEYMKRISNQQNQKEQKVSNSKMIEIYAEKESIQSIGQKSFLYEDEEIKGGLNYSNFYQAKIADFQIASLGSMMEVLHIGEDSHIKQNSKNRLYDRKGNEVGIGQILLHDLDSKGLIRGQNGILYYQDLVKSKLIEQFNPSPKKGIVSIFPEYKMAETQNYNTFKAISQQAIYEIDPRTQQGIGSLKQYSGNPYFTTLTATGSGNIATGSQNGQIRFYKQIGKNANNKFTSVGDPVIHLDTTKDGKWVLATFKRYLRLIPTQNDNQISIFDKKISFDERPTPIKLEISLQDLQKYGVKDFKFLPAKFDENKESLERFIISGFGEYTIIWNLGKAIKGDRRYLISKGQGRIIQADFRYNDPTKLIMATNKGIIVKENIIKK